MAFVGVMMLHVEKYFTAVNLFQRNRMPIIASSRKFWINEWDDMGKSLTWVGFAIALDDEILGVYNGWAEFDIHDAEPYMYFVLGFCIDSWIVRFKKKTGFRTQKIDLELYK